MAFDKFLIRYDGGDATYHSIDMRLLGESLQGFDRTISDLVIVACARRMPKRGERAPLAIKAYEPKSGSVSIPATIQENAALLQLGWQILTASGSDIVKTWLELIVNYFGGDKSKADSALEHIANIALAHAAAQDRTDERRHEEVMGMQEILRAVLEKQGPAAVQMVAPVGPSVRTLSFTPEEKPGILIDEPTADKIREQAKIEFGPLTTFTLRTDGFVFHTRRLSVEHPERHGYLSAEVDDPVAEEENNPYARAVQTKALIKVQAKPGYRNGQMERLVIMDFGGEMDAA